MTVANRLKFTVAITSAATITPPASPNVAGYRVLAQAPELPANTANVPLTSEDASGNWEESYYTVSADGLSFVRTAVATSSAGAATPATFTGTVTVYCTPFAHHLNSGLTNADDPGFDIVLCAGQSNMVGLGTVVANMDIADPRVFQFGTFPSDSATYQKIVTGADPLKHPYESAPGLSPASWFSKTYAGMIPSNRKVLLVPVAQGGNALVYIGGGEVKWAPGSPGGTLYEAAISQSNAAIAAALALYPNSRFVGTIWLQGETDGDWTQSTANYAAALKTLIAGFRSRITGAANSWFVIGGMVPEAIASHAGYPAIQAAHIQVANETAKCAYVPGNSGNQNGDNLHYNAQGARIMGCGMASAVPKAKLAAGVIVPATAVTLTRSASSGYVSAPVTITVGTDNPLTGSQTESVQLASNVAGAFTVNPVALSANTLSATSVFTPSAAGAATITGTATGTPSLTAGTVSYTSNAITAPAQMAAPVATTGINSASIAFTAPANGGATITGYTVTASTGQTATGTTSPISITMPSGTAATFTITATNSVGPSPASPASNSVTPTAAATVPAAPTIGVAVAGDGYVDVAFTHNSNGGAAVIDSTATLSTGQTATGTTSPIRITAPNGTAVTATVKDRNSVGSSAASAVSNSVTPVAPAASTALRFGQFARMTETSTTAPYAYVGASGASYDSGTLGGTSLLALAGDGSVTVQIGNGNGKPMLSIKAQTTTVACTALSYILFADPPGYTKFSGVTGTAGTTGIVPAAGDLMRMTRTGTTLVGAISKDSGNTWTTIYTWTGVAAGTMYAQILAEVSGTIISSASTGFA